MTRFLFVILALVAAILASIFNWGWLYFVAGALLLVSAALVLFHLRNRYRRDHASYRSVPPATSPNRSPKESQRDEWSRAGILSVRPKGTQSTSTGAASGDEAFIPATAEWQASPHPPDLTPGREGPDGTFIPSGPHVTSMYAAGGEGYGPNMGAAVKPYLTSLQTALGLHTVCLFEVDEAYSEYRIISIVSHGSVVPERTFPFSRYFLSQLLPETTVVKIGHDSLSVEQLGYYREPVELSYLIVTPIEVGDELKAFLIADRKKGDAPFDVGQEAVFEQTARVLGEMFAIEPTDSRASSSASQERPRLRLVEVGRYEPHREIIAEEMANARRDDHDLTLALVYLYDDAHAYANAHHVTVEEAEAHVLSQLRQLTPEGRVEHFGEMGFGVFHYGNIDAVATWTEQAYDTLNPPDSSRGQICIGAALLAERHQNPDDLQVDAARALRESFETGDSTILA